MAYEKVTLYGVPIVAARKVNYGRIDPALSRELFIRHALVEGDWQTHHQFFADNRALLDRGRGAGAPGPAPRHPGRRRDPVRLLRRSGSPPTWSPAGTSTPGGRRPAGSSPTCSPSPGTLLVNAGRGGVDEADYPDAWHADGVALPLTYQFEPGTAADGVTVDIPLPLLNQVPAEGFDWQVPGLREELVDRADPVAAQGDPAQLRAGAGLRPRRAGRDHRPARSRCWTR